MTTRPCKGITDKGIRCKRTIGAKARIQGDYCGQHLTQDPSRKYRHDGPPTYYEPVWEPASNPRTVRCQGLTEKNRQCKNGVGRRAKVPGYYCNHHLDQAPSVPRSIPRRGRPVAPEEDSDELSEYETVVRYRRRPTTNPPRDNPVPSYTHLAVNVVLPLQHYTQPNLPSAPPPEVRLAPRPATIEVFVPIVQQAILPATVVPTVEATSPYTTNLAITSCTTPTVDPSVAGVPAITTAETIKGTVAEAVVTVAEVRAEVGRAKVGGAEGGTEGGAEVMERVAEGARDLAGGAGEVGTKPVSEATEVGAEDTEPGPQVGVMAPPSPLGLTEESVFYPEIPLPPSPTFEDRGCSPIILDVVEHSISIHTIYDSAEMGTCGSVVRAPSVEVSQAVSCPAAPTDSAPTTTTTEAGPGSTALVPTDDSTSQPVVGGLADGQRQGDDRGGWWRFLCGFNRCTVI